MEASDFIDYYQILELSPNAGSTTVDRVFRYLAQRYHPDNRETGDRVRFDQLLEAHDALKDPIKRAQYDIKYNNHSLVLTQLAEEARSSNNFNSDEAIRSGLFATLYVKRRQDASNPGIGVFELECLIGCPAELLKFHLWYLKEKGWIVRNEEGMFAITAEGIDHVSVQHDTSVHGKLLTDQHTIS
jgi:curved DNA-binding protein CbpA